MLLPVYSADRCLVLFASRQVGLVYQQLSGLIDGVDLKPSIPGDPGVKSVVGDCSRGWVYLIHVYIRNNVRPRS